MRKVVFEIDKEGQVYIQAEGYQGSECMKSKKVQELIKLLEREGQIDNMEKLYQEEKKTLEELI